MDRTPPPNTRREPPAAPDRRRRRDGPGPGMPPARRQRLDFGPPPEIEPGPL
jgi:hypothetical protein